MRPELIRTRVGRSLDKSFQRRLVAMAKVASALDGALAIYEDGDEWVASVMQEAGSSLQARGSSPDEAVNNLHRQFSLGVRDLLDRARGMATD